MASQGPPTAQPIGRRGGRRRTLVEYECPVPAGNRYLKLVWTGPAELDRVEVYHTGTKPIQPLE